jgi:hypothetical protein
VYVWVFAAGLAATYARGQTLQLPTFAFTTVSTTVSVPDQGSAFLGGINRASDGRSEFGVPGLDKIPMANRLFKNTGIGQARSASSMVVTATIHDFDAMEAALMGSSSAGGIAASGYSAGAAALVRDVPRTPAATLAGQWQPKVDPPGTTSPLADPATEQARRLAQRDVRASEAQQYFERARQAEADGKPSVAKIYYRMAVRRADGDLKEQALARLDALSGATASLAQDQP